MSETTGAAGTQAVPTTQPQAGDPPAQAADAQRPNAGGADDEGSGLDAAGLQRELTAARREAASYRTKLKGYEDAQKTQSERDAERIASLERAQSDWERERQDWQTREMVTVGALRLGFADPADAYSLVDRAALEFDETGKPRNVDRLLTDLIAAKPYLAGASRPSGSFDGGPRGTPATGTNMNDMLRRASGRTS